MLNNILFKISSHLEHVTEVVLELICGYSMSDSLPLSSGVIRTALPNMDRETRDQYVLVIQAKDMVGQMGGLSGTTSVTVTLTDVNDNPPRFTHSKTPVPVFPYRVN